MRAGYLSTTDGVSRRRRTDHGIAELILGGLVIVGLWRRYTYLVVVAIAAITAAGVWRSIVDPWGWYLQGANALFYPSLIILAASLVLLADEWQVSTRARQRPLTNQETFR